MKFDALFDDAHPVRQRRILIVLAVTAVAVGINLAGILFGVTIVLAHLLYFPVILAAYWYPKRCYPFLILIAALYGGFILYFNYPPDLSLIAATASRVVIFTLVGVIVSLLSFNLRRSEQELNDIIEFLPDATFAVNKDGVVIAWNKATEELTGVKKSAILNRGNYEYLILRDPH
ncbi:PAS domain-containing protein [Methanoplanus endosymbiosus]|uniref:PAS domain-containing protein n=1 Tax=Methanoplanus endosymbiosus TaxID=33865 RepID=A0A9E7PNK8_9EURY|nr:PAS domain-containing protein [Methanoplanus endosymbiosus]UUX92612.1 PAS domain-containing protein [Methanoplanus endosymbiosus]